MKPTLQPKIPAIWTTVRPGEFFHCTLPFHRMEAIASALAPVVFEFIPSPKGYFVHRKQ